MKIASVEDTINYYIIKNIVFIPFLKKSFGWKNNLYLETIFSGRKRKSMNYSWYVSSGSKRLPSSRRVKLTLIRNPWFDGWDKEDKCLIKWLARSNSGRRIS